METIKAISQILTKLPTAINQIVQSFKAFKLHSNVGYIFMVTLTYVFLRDHSFWPLLFLFYHHRKDSVIIIVGSLAFVSTYSSDYLLIASLIQIYDNYYCLPLKCIQNFIKKFINFFSKKEETFLKAVNVGVQTEGSQQINQTKLVLDIRTLTGKPIMIQVQRKKTIWDLKLLIKQKQGLPHQYYLLAKVTKNKVKILAIYQTIDECQLRSGDRLEMLLTFNSGVYG